MAVRSDWSPDYSVFSLNEIEIWIIWPGQRILWNELEKRESLSFFFSSLQLPTVTNVLYLLLIMAHMFEGGKRFRVAGPEALGRPQQSPHLQLHADRLKATTQFNGKHNQKKYEHDTFGVVFSLSPLLGLLVNLMVSNCNITPVAVAEKMGRVILAKMALSCEIIHKWTASSERCSQFGDCWTLPVAHGCNTMHFFCLFQRDVVFGH